MAACFARAVQTYLRKIRINRHKSEEYLNKNARNKGISGMAGLRGRGRYDTLNWGKCDTSNVLYSFECEMCNRNLLAQGLGILTFVQSQETPISFLFVNIN